MLLYAVINTAFKKVRIEKAKKIISFKVFTVTLHWKQADSVR